jgi:hypothetical protein
MSQAGKRVASRRTADRCPFISAVRLAPGGDVELVDVSVSGMLVRCARRAVPGAPLIVNFGGTLEVKSVAARVARCEVGGIGADGAIQYKIGVSFNKPIQLPEEELPEVPEPPVVEPEEELFDGTEDDLLAAVEHVPVAYDELVIENRW